MPGCSWVFPASHSAMLVAHGFSRNVIRNAGWLISVARESRETPDYCQLLRFSRRHFTKGGRALPICLLQSLRLGSPDERIPRIRRKALRFRGAKFPPDDIRSLNEGNDFVEGVAAAHSLS